MDEKQFDGAAWLVKEIGLIFWNHLEKHSSQRADSHLGKQYQFSGLAQGLTRYPCQALWQSILVAPFLSTEYVLGIVMWWGLPYLFFN